MRLSVRLPTSRAGTPHRIAPGAVEPAGGGGAPVPRGAPRDGPGTLVDPQAAVPLAAAVIEPPQPADETREQRGGERGAHPGDRQSVAEALLLHRVGLVLPRQLRDAGRVLLRPGGLLRDLPLEGGDRGGGPGELLPEPVDLRLQALHLGTGL